MGETRRELLAELEHGDAEVLELTLPEDLPPVPLVRMKAGVFAIIGAILRGGKVIIPKGADAVQGRDRIIVFCPKEAEEDVRDFFLRRILRLGT
jgi:trk system potassium uptake protein TrkA